MNYIINILFFNNITLREIIVYFEIVCFILLLIVLSVNPNKKNKNPFDKNKNISEFSYQKYAKFYGNIELYDQDFNSKISRIYDLIVNKKYTDIIKITKESGCKTTEECILKIRYLKNKRIIGDYFINHITNIVKKCSKEDKLMLNKYVPYIYGQHLQIDEIATRLPGTTVNTKNKVEDKVYEEIKYLYDKELLNGIILDDIDRTIKYYSVDKKLKAKDFVTMQCKHCGAVNDVRRGGKARCEYCNSIVENKEPVL